MADTNTNTTDERTFGIKADKSLIEIFGGMITVSTTEPTSADGNDGDIWITYSAS